MSMKRFLLTSCLIVISVVTGSMVSKANSQCRYSFENTREGWVVETDPSSSGVLSVESSKLKNFSGDYGLKANLKLSREPSQPSQGEIRVDLESFAPGNDVGPLDLDGKVVTVWIWFPKTYEGDPKSPNGIQLFAKSVEEDSTGNEQWSSLYGMWINAAGQSTNWMKISLKILGKNQIAQELLKKMYVDENFNPKKVRFLGLKFAIGGKASRTTKFSGDIFVDCMSW